GGGGGRQAGGGGGAAAGAPIQLSWDGSEGNPYRIGGGGGGGGFGGGAALGAPGSEKIAGYRGKPGYDPRVNYVRASPADYVHADRSGAAGIFPGQPLP